MYYKIICLLVVMWRYLWAVAAVMHSRTSFEDHDELEKRRKLVRLWVKMHNARTLAPDFPGQNGFPPPD